jgi:hypothetical protein
MDEDTLCKENLFGGQGASKDDHTIAQGKQGTQANVLDPID